VKDATYYRSLPYTRRVDLVEEVGGTVYFLASITELPGLRGSGENHVEALASLRDAFEDYVEAMLTWRRAIPEPVLWPSSFGFDPRAVRPVKTAAAIRSPHPVEASSWGATPNHARWAHAADKIETALV